MARILQVGGDSYLASGAGYYASVPPALALSVVSTDFSEGATITFRVTANKVWDEDVTVAYATGGGTATAGVDYVAASGTVTIPAGSTTADINVVTIDRTGVQADRTFTLTLSAPTTTSGDTPELITAAQTVTIDDTDVALPVPHLVVSVVGTGAEEGSPITFRVSTQDQAPTPTALTFTYATEDGTAVNGVDYVATAGNGFIPEGASSAEYAVTTLARSGYQVARTVRFVITNANTTVDTDTATAVISDTETPTGSHAYFEAMVARADHYASLSLRHQPTIDLYTSGNVNVSAIYSPSTDTDPHAVDGCKFIIAPFSRNAAGRTASAIGATDLAIPMTGVTNISGMNGKSTQYKIGDEIVISAANAPYNQITGALTVSQRGAYGTTAVDHPADTPLYRCNNDLPNQIQYTLNGGTSDGYTWVAGVDYLLTSSWMKINLGGFKTFQFDSANTDIWCEPQTFFGGDGGVLGWNAEVHVANIRARSYNKPGGVADYTLTDGNRLGPGATDDNPLQPFASGNILNRFLMYPNRWTRFLWAFNQRANDYDLFSMWVCDEQQAWFKVYDQIPLSVRGTPAKINRWRIEMDTSSTALPVNRTVAQTYNGETLEAFRDLVAYAKNFFLLRMPANTTEATLIAEGILGPLPEAES